jgi:hypothetical protein
LHVTRGDVRCQLLVKRGSTRDILQEWAAWRKRLAAGQFREVQGTYKNPTSVLSVEIDEVLKAEHCVEPESEMQFCAIAPGAAARAERRAVLVLKAVDRCFRLVEPCLLAGLDELEFCAIVGWRGDCDGTVISLGLALCGVDGWMVLSWPFSRFSSLMFRFAVFPHSSSAPPGASRC